MAVVVLIDKRNAVEKVAVNGSLCQQALVALQAECKKKKGQLTSGCMDSPGTTITWGSFTYVWRMCVSCACVCLVVTRRPSSDAILGYLRISVFSFVFNFNLVPIFRILFPFCGFSLDFLFFYLIYCIFFLFSFYLLSFSPFLSSTF